MNRLAIITTHPIQYYAPLFQVIQKRNKVQLKVFYTWDEHILQNKYDPGFGKEIEWDIPLRDGYDHCFVPNNGRKGKGFWAINNPGLIKAVKDWSATAILVIGWNYRSHLRAMYHFKNKIPVLFRGDSNLLDEKKGVKTWMRRIVLKIVYKNIDYALYVGEANRQYYLKHGLKPEQLIFAPHAIDNNRFAATNDEQEKFIKTTKASLGIEVDCTTIIFCGKFNLKKDPLLLIRAVKTIADKKLHLIMVGNGELESEIKNDIQGCAYIHLLPFQNQSLMPAVYRLGEIFCLPSQGPGETWGLAVNEAMASGKPVIVSDKTGCAADLVEDGLTGYTFHSKDLNDLREKIILCKDDQNLAVMGVRAKRNIQNWSFEHIALAIENVLERN